MSLSKGSDCIEWPTHMLCGIAAGYLATVDWRGAVAGGIAGIFPDIDEPRSKIGKSLFFLSWPIYQLFGHRSFTHSLLFVFIAGTVLGPIIGSLLAQGVIAGLLAHIVGDMITGRLRLFYPWKKKIGVRVSRMTYKALDRLTRLGLSAVIMLFALQIMLH